MDIRRTLLWVIFSFSLLLFWNNWQVYNGREPLFGAAPQSQTATPEQAATDEAAEVADTAIPTATAPERPADEDTSTEVTTAPEPQAQDVSSELTTIDTPLLKLTFDTLGAQLVRAELHEYTAPNDPDHPMVLFDHTDNYTYLAQSGVVGAPAGQQYPTHQTPFELVSTDGAAGSGPAEVVFKATDGDIEVTKTFRIEPDSYAIHVTHELTNHGDSAVQPAVYHQLVRDDSDPQETSTFYRTFTGPALYSEDEKFQKVSFSDIDKGKAKYIASADNGWIGMVQHYFASAWVPAQGTARTNEVLNLRDNLYAIRTIESAGSIQPGDTGQVNADLWVGPQDQKAMSELAPGLELVVDYGWLTILSKPLFKLMTGIHALLGNWGWTIIVLTLLIKAVFYPLSAASYRSMAKMKNVAPRMKALKEKFGDDKAKMNAAMMEMYRTEKINPLGGCLPMLVQIPVFIALYWVLLGSVEMRGAPWVLWIQDLSVRDPWFILPAFMMATMFLQIKLNPTPPDPMQARIMMIMPLVFGGMMFFFPAGLVLYWCMNNAVSIIQQRYIMHRIDKEAAAAAR